MIKSFRDDETEQLFRLEGSRRVPASVQRAALRKLLILDAATDLRDLRVPPGNHLEALRGKRKGQHSVRVNKQWRVCFVWKNSNAFDVEIVDYH
ncbi:MAG: plasmid maintenance system killer protein [Candidatus Magasanikbacteria bacterium RIFCSPHIGHO2_02_FULL_47_14]|uniref:Plasmid maintenance system killer protein n=1 Tax=Candidatus Magasanikbacteria bacterium RIFCSPHIGHO2_02_FULL_47_14 TaxID=1798680 RepID=A0A1F6M4L3_9BACT|nr:MAG: plasmid maintenance system killer protein [Candidatus Magasanikbacteria bacterium RIFCSPHIGHO2_02_FULL_47_14]